MFRVEHYTKPNGRQSFQLVDDSTDEVLQRDDNSALLHRAMRDLELGTMKQAEELAEQKLPFAQLEERLLDIDVTASDVEQYELRRDRRRALMNAGML